MSTGAASDSLRSECAARDVGGIVVKSVRMGEKEGERGR